MSCLDGPIGQAAIRIACPVHVDDALPALFGLARGDDGGIWSSAFLAEDALGLDVANILSTLNPISRIASRTATEASPERLRLAVWPWVDNKRSRLVVVKWTTSDVDVAASREFQRCPDNINKRGHGTLNPFAASLDEGHRGVTDSLLGLFVVGIIVAPLDGEAEAVPCAPFVEHDRDRRRRVVVRRQRCGPLNRRRGRRMEQFPRGAAAL